MIAGRTAPLRILVVEDETPLAIEIVARLQELHYEVVGPVATGDRALELVEQQRPDLVLLDITPAGDRDGIEVAAQLRSLHDLPVIFLLAQSDDATLERVQTTLPLGCLVKPCSGRDLRLALELGFHRLTVDRELRRQRERLEDLVAERTAAWEEANRCLATHINPPQPAENAIQSSLELLQSVVENAPVRVFWKDLNLRYLGCNSWFARDAGFESPSDIVGKTDFELGWKDQAEAYRADDRAVMDKVLTKLGYEEPQTTPDGSLIWLRTSKVPLHGEGGRISGILGIYEDITERKLAEKELRETHDRLTTLFEGARDAIFIADEETSQILDANAAASELLGLAKEEILARRLSDLHPADQAAAYLDQLRGQPARGIRVVEAEIVRADGQLIPVEITASVGTLSSGRRVIHGFYRDVYARKQLEAQMMRRQRLESIGTLAGGVAHDLNNALAPILLVAELLRSQYPAEEDMVDIVATSARRAAEMVKQLLTFARGVEGERQSLQTVHLLREIEKIVRSTFPKNILLRTTFATGLRTVLGDATQLHQVLLNLCVNARDAMPHGGTLTLEAENAEVDDEFASTTPDAIAGPHVVWRIKDTGIGIPPENLDRIFDPFFTTKSPEMGTGLGLSTVLGIVRSHHGFIQVRSSSNQGTTFAIYLPSALPAVSPQSSANMNAAFRGNGESILFVDDEAAVRWAARSVLQRLNFAPMLAADGVEGLAQAAENAGRLCAVITDQHMPHMDGLNFVRVLRRFLPRVPVAIASGRLEPATLDEYRALGVTLRIDKPFSESELAEMLRKLLAH